MIPLCALGFFVPARHIDVGPLQSLAADGGHRTAGLSQNGQALGSAGRLSSTILYDHATRPPAEGRSCAVRLLDSLAEVGMVLRETGFTVVVLAMTALFFLFTGVLFWTTDFLITVDVADKVR